MERIKGANGELMKYSMQPMDGKGHLTLYRYDQLAVGGADNAHLEFWIEIEELRKQLADAQATIAALQKEIATRDSTDSILATRIRELESRLTQRTAELEAAKRERDVWYARYNELSGVKDRQLNDLQAELEAIEKILDIDSDKTTVEKVRDLHHSFKQVWESYQDASNEMFKAQAELEAANKLLYKKNCALGRAETIINDLQAELERVSLLSSHNERRFEMLEEKYKELRTLVLALPKVEGEIAVSADPNGWYVMPLLIRCVTKEQADGIAALLQERQKLC